MIKTAVATFLFLLAAALGVLIYVMFSGVYNIAATEPHNPLMKWALHITMKNSVEHHAKDIETPADFEERETAEGFAHFDEMCVACHGAPGVEPLHFTRGLNPEPPDLAEKAKEWKPAQLHWIIAHGVSMSGMPGIINAHAKQEIWNLTAFVADLPDMTPQEYARLREQTKPSGHRHDPAESAHDDAKPADDLEDLFAAPHEADRER